MEDNPVNRLLNRLPYRNIQPYHVYCILDPGSQEVHPAFFERGFSVEQVEVCNGPRLIRYGSKVESLLGLFDLKHALIDLFQ